MFTITFKPDPDSPEFASAAEEYRKIWKEDGEKITVAWEKATGYTFSENDLEATVYKGISMSHPLMLRYNVPTEQKTGILVHELGHRILFKKAKVKTDSLGRHKILCLILFDLLAELYGEEYAKQTVAYDKQLDSKNGKFLYTEAWDFALAFPKDDRNKEFLALTER